MILSITLQSLFNDCDCAIPFENSLFMSFSIHPLSTLSQYILSAHYLNTSSQHTISIHSLNSPSQSPHPIPSINPTTQSPQPLNQPQVEPGDGVRFLHPPLTHPLNPSCQRTLSTHPLNTSSQSPLLTQPTTGGAR